MIAPGTVATPVPGPPASLNASAPAEENGVERSREAVLPLSTGAVAGAALLSGPAAASASMLLFLIDGTCGGREVQLSWIQHPTRLVVGGSVALGVVIGNFLLVFAVGLVLRLAVNIVTRVPCITQRLSVRDVRALVRFPAAPLFLMLFWYQGTVYGAFYLLFHPSATWQALLGFAASCVLLAAPFLLALKIDRNVPRYGQAGRAYYREDSVEGRPLFLFFFGPGEWVSKEKDCLWGQRYQTMIKRYRQRFAWFSLVDFLAMALVAAATAISPKTAVPCGHVRVALCIISFATLVLEVLLKPHARGSDNVADTARLTFQTAALLFMAAGFYSENGNHWGFDASVVCFMGAIGVILVKVLVDAVAELYQFRIKRRSRIQAEAWDETCMGKSVDFADGEDWRHGVYLGDFIERTATMDDCGRKTSTVKSSSALLNEEALPCARAATWSDSYSPKAHDTNSSDSGNPLQSLSHADEGRAGTYSSHPLCSFARNGSSTRRLNRSLIEPWRVAPAAVAADGDFLDEATQARLSPPLLPSARTRSQLFSPQAPWVPLPSLRQLQEEGGGGSSGHLLALAGPARRVRRVSHARQSPSSPSPHVRRTPSSPRQPSSPTIGSPLRGTSPASAFRSPSSPLLAHVDDI
ncbi:hypothetical protein DIPPA_06984 [Diplonema papillatum]|nr:hypothetical protein DIPPA_06984 [Diplonema papillatum]